VARTCPQCGGAGKVIKDPCLTCSGAGRVREEKKISVKIPSGVDDGSRLRVGGEGESGFNGGPPGDLYVFISVREHERFTRRDYDIHSEESISVTQAALGGEVKTETIDGFESLKIPSGTQPNQVFRLRGKGVPFLDGSGRGDHYVHVGVRIPTTLSPEQRPAPSTSPVLPFAPVRWFTTCFAAVGRLRPSTGRASTSSCTASAAR
jgi:molecular chaperone DnaJ